MIEIRIDAMEADAFLGGFYPAETHSDGSCFRWTGPSRVSQIRVLADRGQILFGTLTLFGAVSKINLKAIQCLVDGTFVDVVRNPSGFPYQFNFSLPRRRFGCDTCIEFIVHETVSPRERGEGADDRRLGVIFSELTLASAISERKEALLRTGMAP